MHGIQIRTRNEVRKERTKNGNVVILTKYYKNDRVDRVSREVKCTEIKKLPFELSYLSFDNSSDFKLPQRTPGGRRVCGFHQNWQRMQLGPKQNVVIKYIRDEEVVAEIKGSDKQKLQVFQSLTQEEAKVLGKYLQRTTKQIHIHSDFLTGLRQLLSVRKNNLKLVISPRHDEVQFGCVFRYDCLTELVLPYCLESLKQVARRKTLRVIERLPNLESLYKTPTSSIRNLNWVGLFFKLTVVRGRASDSSYQFLEMFRFKFEKKVRVFDQVQNITKEEALFFFHQTSTLTDLGVIENVELQCDHFNDLSFLDLKSNISIT